MNAYRWLIGLALGLGLMALGAAAAEPGVPQPVMMPRQHPSTQPAASGATTRPMMAMLDGMMPRGQTAVCAAVAPTDPAALLAAKDRLQLTGEQVDHLKAIEVNARKDAEALLTAAQKERLVAMGQDPMSNPAMQQKMQDMKQKMQASSSGGGMMDTKPMPMMACPMMPTVAPMKAGATTRPFAQTIPSDHVVHH